MITKWKFALALVLFIGAPAIAQVGAPQFTHVTITMKAEGGPCGMVCSYNEYLSCCPAFSVSLNENGTVIYHGLGGVKERGKRIHSIPFPAVRALVAEFLRIDFYSLHDRYTEKALPNGMIEIIDHANATTISIDLDGRKKSVYIFYGAPDELLELERKLTEVTQIARYTGH
jgi:hypothetical protein